MPNKKYSEDAVADTCVFIYVFLDGGKCPGRVNEKLRRKSRCQAWTTIKMREVYGRGEVDEDWMGE